MAANLQTGMPGTGGFFSLFEGLPETKFHPNDLQQLAQAMSSAEIGGARSCDSGYVYLGQLITHDITERGSLPKGEFARASELVQLRTPELDLDNVYGDGFDDARIDVDKDTGKMRLDRVVDSNNEPGSYDDLPRNGLKARIGDDRDDENLLIAQLHVQFLKLHNLFVDRIRKQKPEGDARQCFDEARHNLILCYQDVILYDYLPTVIDPRIWGHVIGNNKSTLWKPEPVRGQPARVPIEFAAAAFRFGHAMVRPSYVINNRQRINANDLFLMTGAKRLGGRPALPDTHIVDWRLFFSELPREKPLPFPVNRALRIDPIVGVSVDVPGQGKFLLADLDLSTGNFSRLPDAQTIVSHLEHADPPIPGLEPLTDKELNPVHLLRGVPPGLTKQSPLFYYVLCEAHARQQGARLGPLGSLIVAETLRALIYLSSPSVLNEDDKLLSGIGVQATGAVIGGRQRFRMIDLLKAVIP